MTIVVFFAWCEKQRAFGENDKSLSFFRLDRDGGRLEICNRFEKVYNCTTLTWHVQNSFVTYNESKIQTPNPGSNSENTSNTTDKSYRISSSECRKIIVPLITIHPRIEVIKASEDSFIFKLSHPDVNDSSRPSFTSISGMRYALTLDNEEYVHILNASEQLVEKNPSCKWESYNLTAWYVNSQDRHNPNAFHRVHGKLQANTTTTTASTTQEAIRACSIPLEVTLPIGVVTFIVGFLSACVLCCCCQSFSNSKYIDNCSSNGSSDCESNEPTKLRNVLRQNPVTSLISSVPSSHNYEEIGPDEELSRIQSLSSQNEYHIDESGRGVREGRGQELPKRVTLILDDPEGKLPFIDN